MNIDLGKAIFDALFSDENRDKMIDETNGERRVNHVASFNSNKIIKNGFERKTFREGY